MSVERVTFFKDAKGEWRWKWVDGNNRTLGDSGEGYNHWQDAVKHVKERFPDLPLVGLPTDEPEQED